MDYPEHIGPGLRGRIERRPGGVTLALAGELDVASAAAFAERIDGALIEGCENLVLDLAGVEFLDSTGILVMLDAQRRLADLGVGLALTEAHGPVMRTLGITGLLSRLSVSAEEARDAV